MSAQPLPIMSAQDRFKVIQSQQPGCKENPCYIDLQNTIEELALKCFKKESDSLTKQYLTP